MPAALRCLWMKLCLCWLWSGSSAPTRTDKSCGVPIRHNVTVCLVWWLDFLYSAASRCCVEGNPALSRYFGLVTSVIVAVSKVNRYGLVTTAVFQLSAQCFSFRRRCIQNAFMAYPPGRPMGKITGKFEKYIAYSVQKEPGTSQR
jgi:hypothetical protein